LAKPAPVEVVARLIHQLDPDRGSAIRGAGLLRHRIRAVGSEFFGQSAERSPARRLSSAAAFALAMAVLCFSTEIGELPLTLQAQLLRVHSRTQPISRVGGSTWHRTAFRLVCATNRNVAEMVSGRPFRADLFHRIASFVCNWPLRERPEDIIPLAEHFFRRPIRAARRLGLIQRYDISPAEGNPGNVRGCSRSIQTDVPLPADNHHDRLRPIEERPTAIKQEIWWIPNSRQPIERAVVLGAGLRNRAALPRTSPFNTRPRRRRQSGAGCASSWLTDRALHSGALTARTVLNSMARDEGRLSPRRNRPMATANSQFAGRPTKTLLRAMESPLSIIARRPAHGDETPEFLRDARAARATGSLDQAQKISAEDQRSSPLVRAVPAPSSISVRRMQPGPVGATGFFAAPARSMPAPMSKPANAGRSV